MPARIWNLRLNLDVFNSAYVALDSDAERSQFLAGLARGMNGTETREGASSSWLAGFAMGSSMRSEADGFREAKSQGGRLSAERRAAKYGTAQPSAHSPESKSTRSDFEVSSRNARTDAEPIYNLQTESTNTPCSPPAPSVPRDVPLPKPPKASPSWKDLFRDRPDALPWFEVCLKIHRESSERIRRMAAVTGAPYAAPDVTPGPDARAFLALVGVGKDPRVLAACLRLFLKSRQKDASLFIQGLKVFFGMPGRSTKCTWEGYWDEACAAVSRSIVEQAANGVSAPPLPAPPGPASPAALPVFAVALPGLQS